MAGARYVVSAVNLPEHDWCFQITAEKQVIGRGRDADVRVREKNFGVSRRHAEIWHNGRPTIVDLGSTVGTWVRNIRLVQGEETVLEPGDRIRLGMLELELLSRDDFSCMKRLSARTLDDDEDSLPAALESRDRRILKRMQSVQDAHLDVLTPTEREVVLWLMRGAHSEHDMAQRTNRSPNTIRTHLNNIFRKLGVHSRHELMGLLLRNCQDGNE